MLRFSSALFEIRKLNREINTLVEMRTYVHHELLIHMHGYLINNNDRIRAMSGGLIQCINYEVSKIRIYIWDCAE